MKLQFSIASVVSFAAWIDVSRPSINEAILVLITLTTGLLAVGSSVKEGE